MKWTVKLKTLNGDIATITTIAKSHDDAKSLAELMILDEDNGLLGAHVI